MRDALVQGLQITVVGMGLVFLLLGLLQGLLVLMVKTDRPAPEPEPEPVAAAGEDEDEDEDEALDPALLAAVMLAVRQHRIAVRRQATPAMRANYLPGTLHSRWVVAGRTRQNRSWAPGGRFI